MRGLETGLLDFGLDRLAHQRYHIDIAVSPFRQEKLSITVVSWRCAADHGRTQLSGESLYLQEDAMVQKVIEVVGYSKDSFAKAAEDAVKEAAKTVQGMKWARVTEFEMELDGGKVLQYGANTKIYFDVKH
jgi:dodecin